MAGNTFGTLFRITTAGESHGPGNVVIIDGVPPDAAKRAQFGYNRGRSSSLRVRMAGE